MEYPDAISFSGIDRTANWLKDQGSPSLRLHRAIVEQMLRSPQADLMLRWHLIQRMFWVHGVNNLYDLVKEMARFRISSVAHQIGCPTLITAAEGNPIAAGARTLCYALQYPKAFMEFSLSDGSGGHCESLARALYHQRVFDWLDETLHSAH